MVRLDEVVDAFDIVLDEVEKAVKDLNNNGSQAFQGGNYEKAKDLIDKGFKMSAFREKVLALKEEWNNLSFYVPKKIDKKSRGKYLGRGLRTPGKEYRIPILQILSETKEGVAPNKYVIERVEVLMKDKLNDYDKERASGKSQDIRWINTANWERYKMIRDGLLKDNSPRGIWEISEEGRKWLSDNMKNR